MEFDLFIKKLENEKFKISKSNLEYTILYDSIELIIFKKDKNIEIISLREDICKIKKEDKKLEENINTFLLKCKEVIKEKTKKEKETEFNEDRPILYAKSDFTVREIPLSVGFLTLMDYLDKNLIVIPKNQRNYIWTKDQVEKLACSLICGYPIPPLYGYRNKQNQIVILDGQQRLVSMYLYYKNKYLKSTSKMLINLKEILSVENNSNKTLLDQLSDKFGIKDQEYYLKKISKQEEGYNIKEITYGKLDESIKRILDFRSINIIEIMVIDQDNTGKENIYFEIFGNLNQGGTQLKNQELRNGIYSGPFYDMLHRINDNNSTWRQVFGDKHKHSRDVEFLLRFAMVEYMFSLTDGKVDLDYYYDKVKDDFKNSIGRFEGSFPTLLNDFSTISLNFSDEEIKKFENNINIFLNRLVGVNKTYNLLVESLYFASLYIPGDYEIENSLIKEISESLEYKDIVESASSSRKKVKNRLEYVYKKLKERYGSIDGK